MFFHLDDLPQNLFKITAEECKKSFPVDVRRSTTSLLKVVLKVMTENGIYSLPMKVILTSLVCLFFARRPHQNCARVSHAMAQSFQTTLLLVKRSAAFSYPDYSKLNSNWNTYTNPPPDQYRTHAQSHIAWALADSCLDPGASLLGTSAGPQRQTHHRRQ